MSPIQRSKSTFFVVSGTACQTPAAASWKTCCVPLPAPLFVRRIVRLTRYTLPSRRKSNSTFAPGDSLLINSTALDDPPRWLPNSAYVKASKTDDLPLPFVPASIHKLALPKSISCSPL